MGTSSLIDRTILAVVKTRALDRFAMKALMKASELLGLALGVRLAELRDSKDPLQRAFAKKQASLLLSSCLDEVTEIVGSRWDKIADKKRPQYTPEQRYRILRLKRLLAWSRRETARRFRVSAETIARWEREAEGSDTPSSERTLVRPEQPVRRYADVDRQLVHTMRLCGFGGYERIAQTLARAGFRISSRTVGRILREQPPLGSPAAPSSRHRSRGLQARFPNHVFLVDLTELSSFFGLFRFHFALILDVFSRMPLGAQLFSRTPTGNDLAKLLGKALRRFGPPRHLVSDRGTQFTFNCFRDSLRAFGIHHRFGAIGRTGSIAVLERLWRTLKDLLRLRAFPPLVKRPLELRLELGLRYYAFLRPHQGLGGATPSEIYFRRKPAHLSAIPPPRGRLGERPFEPLLRVEFLDREGRLPILVKAA